jgi:hypothetical protein
MNPENKGLAIGKSPTLFVVIEYFIRKLMGFFGERGWGP